MAHPDLFNDELFQITLDAYDHNIGYARIDLKRGLVLQHNSHGGAEDAVPREQLLIASTIQQFIDNGQGAYWTEQKGKAGIVFEDEGEFIPLDDLGVNKKLGFYRLSLFPSAENDAGGY